jgi:hypothetical protein
MTPQAPIEIPLSKQKLVLGLVASILFVGLGLWFLIQPPKIDSLIFGNPLVIFLGGLGAVVVFGFTTVVALRRLASNQAGLIINHQGIIDNSSIASAGPILWADMEEIKVATAMNQRFLVLVVNNPEHYLDREPKGLKKITMEQNYKSYGSPVTLSPNTLQIKFDQLLELLNAQMQQHKPR